MKTSILIVLLVFTLTPYSAMSQISEADEEKADKLEEQAQDAYLDKNYDLAYSLVKQVIALNPQQFLIYSLRGKIRREMGNDASALKDFEHEIKRYPDLPSPYYEIAELHIANKVPKKAYDTYSRAIAIFSKNKTLLYLRAELAEENHWHDKALADYEKLLQLKPNDSGYLQGKAIALGKLGKKNEELAIYKHLVKLYPKEAYLYEFVGLMHEIDKKDYPTAAKYYQRAWQLGKNAGDKKRFLSSLNRALLDWREKAYEGAMKFSSFTQAQECLVGLEWGLLLHYANSEYRSKEPEFVYNSERRMCHFRLKQDAPTGTTLYWEHPIYTQAWKHYKAQEWAKAKTQFQALQKVFAKETVLGKAVEICDLMLGNYTLEEEKK